MRGLFTIFMMTLLCFSVKAEDVTSICVDASVCAVSPSGKNKIYLDYTNDELLWSVWHNGVELVAPSRLSMTTDIGTWGVFIADYALFYAVFCASTDDFFSRCCTVLVEVYFQKSSPEHRKLKKDTVIP